MADVQRGRRRADLGLGKNVNQNNIDLAQVADLVVDDVRKHWHAAKQQEPPEVACQPLLFSILILSPKHIGPSASFILAAAS